jgi:hypothetical protein
MRDFAALSDVDIVREVRVVGLSAKIDRRRYTALVTLSGDHHTDCARAAEAIKTLAAEAL